MLSLAWFGVQEYEVKFMSDLVQFILDSVKGSRVVASGGARSSRSLARRKRSELFIANFDKKTKEKKVCPYGLASLGNNWENISSSILDLKNGFIQDVDIVENYKKMIIRVNGKRTPLLVNDKGEVRTFPLKSRWNQEYHYGYIVGQKALDQVKGLRKVSHLILTIAPERLKYMKPDWWCWGDEEFMAVFGGQLVSEFLHKLRAYKKKHGEPNNFVTWVMEFTEKGMAHFHLIFYGSWVADLEVLKSFWPYSEGQGIRFGKPIRHQDNGAALARYLTRYITKDLQQIEDKTLNKKMERIRAFLWYFKRRLYNLRHKIKNSDGEYTLGIGREQFVNPMKWRKYIPPFEMLDVNLFEREFEGFKENCEFS